MLEGIMMKNKERYSVAVRKPDGEIEVKVDVHEGIGGRSMWAKLPLVRGGWSILWILSCWGWRR